jgi:HD-like signal output (HDOD) protein
MVHNFGYHLFASQFPLIEQDALVFLLLQNKKNRHVVAKAHKLFHLPLCIRIGHSLTKSRSLSPPPPSPFVSAAMLDERSEKNTSEREREKKK